MKALAGLTSAGFGMPGTVPDAGGETALPVTVDASYLFAGPEFDTMDYVAPVYIAFLARFFVFLLTCVAFIRERSQGTMERLLATPATRLEVVLGYILGLGLFALIQVAIILFFTVLVLKIHYLGSLALLFLILRTIVRRQWLTLGVAFALIVPFTALDDGVFATSPLPWILGAAFIALTLFTFIRLGLLTLLVASIVSGWTGAFPTTSDFSAWYAGTAMVGPLVVLALAIFGFWVSLAGRPLIKDGLLEP